MTLSCGHEPTPGEGVGYGKDAEDKTYCYACCGERDRLDMTLCGRATLYLNAAPQFGGAERPSNTWTVTNWPGSLSYAVHRGATEEEAQAAADSVSLSPQVRGGRTFRELGK